MLKTVRKGKLAPLTCPDCGCRLNFVTVGSISFAHHFSHSVHVERDARGCICPSIGVIWNIPSEKVKHLNQGVV